MFSEAISIIDLIYLQEREREREWYIYLDENRRRRIRKNLKKYKEKVFMCDILSNLIGSFILKSVNNKSKYENK